MVVGTTAAPEVKRSAGWLITIGVLLVIAGILAIGSPLISGVSVAILVGSLLLVGGFLQMVHAFRARTWGTGLFVFVGGLLTMICGLLVLAHPIYGLAFMTLLLVVYFFIDGISEIVLAFQLRPVRGWGWTLFGGIVTLLLAILIWRQWPLSGAWAIGVLVGIKLIFTGWAMVMLGAAARAVAADALETQTPAET